LAVFTTATSEYLVRSRDALPIPSVNGIYDRHTCQDKTEAL
jgi:hypothetical protein